MDPANAAQLQQFLTSLRPPFTMDPANAAQLQQFLTVEELQADMNLSEEVFLNILSWGVLVGLIAVAYYFLSKKMKFKEGRKAWIFCGVVLGIIFMTNAWVAGFSDFYPSQCKQPVVKKSNYGIQTTSCMKTVVLIQLPIYCIDLVIAILSIARKKFWENRWGDVASWVSLCAALVTLVYRVIEAIYVRHLNTQFIHKISSFIPIISRAVTLTGFTFGMITVRPPCWAPMNEFVQDVYFSELDIEAGYAPLQA